MPEGSKSRIRFSKLYSFSCLKSPFRDGHSQIGRKGYSRVVYCNDPDNPEAVQLNYGGNYVSTTKYTAFNFIPKSLFEQFRRVANIYFLVVACVSFSPLAPFTALSIVAPLLVVIGATMAKEAVEDWRRRKQQILLRDSKLKNTDYIYGIVIFTGHDTKVMQNSTDPPSKRSKIERKMDKIIYILFSTLVLISFIGSVFFGVETKRDISSGRYRRWYLRPDNTTVFYDPRRATLAAVLHFLTALMLYGYLIPISLYVSIELVKVLQSIFINHDQEMYFEETDRPARARTSNLNEELGQVDTILSDKTGTLTCNSMEFVKCSIGGIPYGRGMTEVEKALVRRGSDVESEVDGGSSDILESQIVYRLLHVFEFSSSRKRMSVIVRNEENQLLLLCKGADSVMFERISQHGRQFEAETRDHIKRYSEAGLRTLVIAYRELDEEEYKLWDNEFSKIKTTVTEDRDVLVDAAADKMERDLILLGATAVEDRLQKGVPECIEKLARAKIKLWVLTGDKMETAVNIGYACSLLRQDMKQIVITLDSPDILSLEKQGDKEALSKASLESIKKQIREGISQIKSAKESSNTNKGSSSGFGLIIDGKSLDYSLNKNLERSFFELAINCASVICCRSSPKQKARVTKLVKLGTGKTTLSIGDGANDVGMLQEADIGVGISGAEGMQIMLNYGEIELYIINRVVKPICMQHRIDLEGEDCSNSIRTTLTISLVNVRSQPLKVDLLVASHFDASVRFSGQPLHSSIPVSGAFAVGTWTLVLSAYINDAAYNDWYMSFYNVFFTSLPVIALGVFDQDVSAKLCLKYPYLYLEGVEDILFSWPRILGWMLNGVLSSLVIFFLTTNSVLNQAFRRDGKVVDFEILGVTMYTCVVWTVNCQMALSINYFTWIQHFFIWGSIAFWYVFVLVYGYLSPAISTTAYRVFVEACAPSGLYWLVTLLVVVCVLLPYFSYRSFQSRFLPMYHDIIQRKQVEGHEVGLSDDELPKQVQGKLLHLRERLKQREL
ncbi:hypothetical protein JHK87_011306 [Glycine soja]|nr:hypothetical protein JHK87_011306 [Glycine soja]